MRKVLVFWACLIALSSWGCSRSGPADIADNSLQGLFGQKIVTFQVIGKGLEPENASTKGEAILLAERAAVADGYRKLVEKIRGVYVDAYTKAGRGSIDQDTIQIHTKSWIRGAEVVNITREDYGITFAWLRLRINFSKKGMEWVPVGIADQG
ncbi:hypothetical protein [uncultured Desulfobacter sp.]|uniref:hypothetical protein n=1 Tax=uncultured Desulfobacter sp. TaxID=240139 RepID=UPI002AABA5E8|nr:hypothetical protein [uncultured Desulfobacter sp.]